MQRMKNFREWIAYVPANCPLLYTAPVLLERLWPGCPLLVHWHFTRILWKGLSKKANFMYAVKAGRLSYRNYWGNRKTKTCSKPRRARQVQMPEKCSLSLDLRVSDLLENTQSDVWQHGLHFDVTSWPVASFHSQLIMFPPAWTASLISTSRWCPHGEVRYHAYEEVRC